MTNSPLRHYKTVEEYQAFAERLAGYKDEQQKINLNRLLCRTDLFWLLWFACGRLDIGKQWLLDRCKEVEEKPNNHIDLWARNHYKSTILTFGKTIQDILASHGDDPLPDWDREATFGIFSATRPLAKGFLRQIKQELEGNKLLQNLFPDILFEKPQAESPKWALDINTPILTSKGWKKHGDLQIGDRIYGSDGKLINVIGTSGTMLNSKCFKVKFDDCEIIASAEHLWSVECKKGTGGKWKEAETRILKTIELKAKSKTMRLNSTPIVFIENKLLDVDPYILGLWLGDGTIGTNIITMHRDDEEECLEQFKKAGYKYYIHRRKPNDNFSMYGLKGLKQQLEKLGCLRNKHIPQEYLFNSVDNRLALLQGLMDSDGTCKKDSKYRAKGMCTFSNTNIELIEGAWFIINSLGLRPSRLKFTPKQRFRKDANHIYFVGLKSIPPFRIKRKLENCIVERTKKHRYIKAIEPIDSLPVNCIKVDAKDSLYLAGYNLVPTHNSEDDGIIVKRKSNPKEATVEAWGLIDGMPVGKHFLGLIYDDVVTDTNVTTPEMIQKTTEKWELSSNLGTSGGFTRIIGTRYHFSDTYQSILTKKIATPRIYPCTDNGTFEGNPVLLSRDELEKKKKVMGVYIFNCQMLLNPVADSLQNFKFEWLRYFTGWYRGLEGNTYVIVDPANSKKKSSDYTVMMVVMAREDGYYYIIDMVRDRMNLAERTDKLFALVHKYKPMLVGYEQYGMQADIEHIREKMDQINYRFNIKELGGKMAKVDRIGKLVPDFQAGRILLPRKLDFISHEGKLQNLVDIFIKEEYLTFPTSQHDDMLDALARIKDESLNVIFPAAEENEKDVDYQRYFNDSTRDSITGY